MLTEEQKQNQKTPFCILANPVTWQTSTQTDGSIDTQTYGCNDYTRNEAIRENWNEINQLYYNETNSNCKYCPPTSQYKVNDSSLPFGTSGVCVPRVLNAANVPIWENAVKQFCGEYEDYPTQFRVKGMNYNLTNEGMDDLEEVPIDLCEEGEIQECKPKQIIPASTENLFFTSKTAFEGGLIPSNRPYG